MFTTTPEPEFLQLDDREEQTFTYPLYGGREYPPFTEALPPSYKVVFLDIDGTINGPLDGPHAFKVQPHPAAVLDRECIRRLNQITDVSGAFIVVSSAWRYRYRKSLPRLLTHAGVKGRIIGMTPGIATTKLSRTPTRGQEIVHWMRLLTEQGLHLPSGVAVLDDLNEIQPLHEHAVRVYEYTGLRDEDVAHALGLLAKPFRFTIPPMW